MNHQNNKQPVLMNQTNIYDELSILLEGGVSTTQSFSNVYLPQRDVCEATQQAIKTPTCSPFHTELLLFLHCFPKTILKSDGVSFKQPYRV